jgi:hypothetical protein
MVVHQLIDFSDVDAEIDREAFARLASLDADHLNESGLPLAIKGLPKSAEPHRPDGWCKYLNGSA